MKVVLRSFCLVAVIAGFSLTAMAQSAISPEKRKLIGELVTVMKMDSDIEKSMDMFLNLYDSVYLSTIKGSLDRQTDLSPGEREKLETAMVEKSKAFSKKFRERLPAAVNFPEFIHNTVYSLYDKTFTEKEIADLIVFYKSPTGQKVLAAMPQLTADTMELTQKILAPKLTKLVEDIMAEDAEALKAVSGKHN